MTIVLLRKNPCKNSKVPRRNVACSAFVQETFHSWNLSCVDCCGPLLLAVFHTTRSSICPGKCVIGHIVCYLNRVLPSVVTVMTWSALVTSPLLCYCFTVGVDRLIMRSAGVPEISLPLLLWKFCCFLSVRLCNMEHGLLKCLLFWFNFVLSLISLIFP